jgi:hypothetical protein
MPPAQNATTEVGKLPLFNPLYSGPQGIPYGFKVVADVETASSFDPIGLRLSREYFGGAISMKSRHYDIVRKERNKSAIWLEAASDLNTAESWIEELTSFWPGEFQIMDQQNHQIVEDIISLPDRNQGAISWTKRSL